MSREKYALIKSASKINLEAANIILELAFSNVTYFWNWVFIHLFSNLKHGEKYAQEVDFNLFFQMQT